MELKEEIIKDWKCWEKNNDCCARVPWCIAKGCTVWKDKVLSMQPAMLTPSLIISKRGGKRTRQELDSRRLSDEHSCGLPMSQVLMQDKAGTLLKDLMAEWKCCCWSVYSFIHHLFYWTPNMSQTYLLATGNMLVTKTNAVLTLEKLTVSGRWG